jgi:hypothetical protein
MSEDDGGFRNADGTFNAARGRALMRGAERAIEDERAARVIDAVREAGRPSWRRDIALATIGAVLGAIAGWIAAHIA